MGAGVIGTYIGVEAVVLRSWCVVLCTVCQLVSNWRGFEKVIVKLFASSWYIFLTYYGEARGNISGVCDCPLMLPNQWRSQC